MKVVEKKVKKTNEDMKKEEQQIYQDYETLKKMAREDVVKELIKELEKIKEWSEPQDGAGEGLGALAGIGMYAQYDNDCKKHKEQIEELIKKIR